MSATMPGIGHNRVPVAPMPEEVVEALRDQFSQLTDRADALAGSVSRFIGAHPTIENDTVQGLAAEVVRQAKAHVRLIETKRIEAKAPYIEAGKTVDGWFKQIAARLADLAKVESAMTAYARKIEAERRRAAEEEARKAREEAARKAALAIIVEAEEAEAVAEAAATEAARATAAATVKPAELSRTYGEFGAVSSLAETWDFEVEDISRIPLAFLRVDEIAVRHAIRHDKIRVIPGLRIFATKSVRVR